MGIATVFDPAVNHLFRSEAAGAVTVMIDDDDATPAIHLLAQILNPVCHRLLGIVVGKFDVVGNTLGQDRTHEIFAITRG